MKPGRLILFACIFPLILFPFCVSPADSENERESYLSWRTDQAVEIGKSARIYGVALTRLPQRTVRYAFVDLASHALYLQTFSLLRDDTG